MKDWLAWLVLLLVSLLLIIAGFGGAMGKVLACIVAPSQVVMNEEGF